MSLAKPYAELLYTSYTKSQGAQAKSPEKKSPEKAPANGKTPPPKKTIYKIDPRQLNIIELKRKLNNEKIKSKNPDHCHKLFELEDSHRKALNLLVNKKRAMEEESLEGSFKPHIDQKSKDLVSNIQEKVESRTHDWNERKIERINAIAEDLKKKKDDDEMKHMVPFYSTNPNKSFEGPSKVKEFISHFKDYSQLQILNGNNIKVRALTPLYGRPKKEEKPKTNKNHKSPVELLNKSVNFPRGLNVSDNKVFL